MPNMTQNNMNEIGNTALAYESILVRLKHTFAVGLVFPVISSQSWNENHASIQFLMNSKFMAATKVLL